MEEARHRTVAAGIGYRSREKLRLMDQMRLAIRRKHYSRSTEKAYCGWVRRYILFHGKRHPAELGADEVATFLSYLAVQCRVAARTQNQALHAILFLYAHVLGVELPRISGISPARTTRRLPVVLTREEVALVLDALHGVPETEPDGSSFPEPSTASIPGPAETGAGSGYSLPRAGTATAKPGSAGATTSTNRCSNGPSGRLYE